MEIPLLELFLKNISSFLRLSCKDNKSFDIVEKYYIEIEELLKLIKPVLEPVMDVEVASHESLQKGLADMSQSVDNLRKVLEECHPLMSKVYFVLKVESLFTKIHTHGLNILDLIQSCEGLLIEPSSLSLKKIKHMTHEKPLDVVSRAIIDEDRSSDITSQIADLLSLSSNQEFLIELVALETIKESAGQAEYIEEMISLVTHMHDRFIEMKHLQNNNSIPIPPDLCCPLSLKLMTDPVIVSSGQTYEREYITNWINLGLTICPKTMQIFVHTNLTPNYAIRALIANWCESNNVKLPDPIKASLVHQVVDESLPQALTATTTDASEEVSTQPPPTIRNVSMSRSQTFRSTRVCSDIETRVKKLVEDLNSTSLEVVKNATSELRLLARDTEDIRNVIADCGAIPLLTSLLNSPNQYIQENSVTALLNLSINDINKISIGNANSIEPLIHVLKTGSPEAKENSAATLSSLAFTENYKIKIGRSGAIEPLVDLLRNGTPRGKKDAATALYNLSTFKENQARIVEAGAVRLLVELMDPAVGMIDKAVAILSILATIPEGRAEIGQEGCVPMLVEVVELGSAREKENAAAGLLQLCTNSIKFCNMVLREGAVPPLVILAQSGTPRAKEKAQSLLRYFREHRQGNVLHK